MTIEEIATNVDCSKQEIRKWKDDEEVYSAVSEIIFEKEF